jgi:hypothetical protein
LLASFVYLALRRFIELVWLRYRSQQFKELAIVVLRHELVIRRTWPDLTLESAGFIHLFGVDVPCADAAVVFARGVRVARRLRGTG